MIARVFAFAVAGCWGLACGFPAAAQMVTVKTPFQSAGHRFFEQSNVNWAAGGNNWFARFGGAGVGAPPFGGFNPNAGLSTGIGFGAGNTRGNLSLGFSQGASTHFTSTTPMLTVTNGVPGQLFVGSTRPFVTGYAPVVGGGGFFNVPSPYVDLGPANTVRGRILRGELDPSMLRVRSESAVAPPIPRENVIDFSVRPSVDPVPGGPAGLRALKEAEARATAEEARDFYARGLRAEEGGQPGIARIHYQNAQRRARGEFRDEIAARLAGLSPQQARQPR